MQSLQEEFENSRPSKSSFKEIFENSKTTKFQEFFYCFYKESKLKVIICLKNELLLLHDDDLSKTPIKTFLIEIQHVYLPTYIHTFKIFLKQQILIDLR